MFNYILSRIQRPEKGWDPVPEEHARTYAENEWSYSDTALQDNVNRTEDELGPLAGRRVLDLGGGPGQYAAEFARRGAQVTWHDVSARYRQIASDSAAALGLADRIRFSVGYLEDARELEPASFDIVWCRICWYYCMNDAAFARIIADLVRPGGAAWIISPLFPRTSLKANAVWQLNRFTGIKIGHPCPPAGRIERLFSDKPRQSLRASILEDGDEEIVWVKAPA